MSRSARAGAEDGVGGAGGPPVEITFHGAANTVTGSCVHLRLPGGTLLVDCGLFQGPKALQALNYAALPVDPGALDAAILTHAHIDHAGMFPKLVRDGFHRRAWATPATCDLLEWILTDAAAIHENEAERLERRNRKRGAGEAVRPLYTIADAERSLKHLAPVEREQWFEPVPGTRARLRHAGHILGAAWVEMEIGGRSGERPLRLALSGDIGPRDKTLTHDPAPLDPVDVLVLESTYGDRDRPAIDEAGRRAALAAEVRDAMAAGGNLIIPSFAVERSQELIHDLLVLSRRREIPPVQIFLDSPLAHRATDVFRRHARELEIEGDGKTAFDGPNLHIVETVEQSKSIGRVQSGAIVIAGSGMCDAGRVKHHLKDNLWRPQATVLFVGYQAPGTLGHLIRNGAERVRIHGEEVAVRARIRSLDVFSGHADRSDLLAWAGPAARGAKAVFLVHGEPAALTALGAGLEEVGADPARIRIPQLDDRFALRGAPDRLEVVPLPAAGRRADPELKRALASGRDWHNDYAAAMLDMRRALLAAPDDAARHRMLERLRAALANGAAG
jgi:metallo-beta-lactamase family protein